MKYCDIEHIHFHVCDMRRNLREKNVNFCFTQQQQQKRDERRNVLNSFVRLNKKSFLCVSAGFLANNTIVSGELEERCDSQCDDLQVAIGITVESRFIGPRIIYCLTQRFFLNKFCSLSNVSTKRNASKFNQHFFSICVFMFTQH